MPNYRQLFAKHNRQREQLLSVNPKLNDYPGIYFLLRKSEEGFKFAYIGQTRQGILSRLISHLNGYEQHIDLSLKRHKLWSKENPYGWRIEFLNCSIDKLDDLEKKYIRQYADAGYQLRNSSLGGQGVNKASGEIGERKAPKGYRAGIQQGKKTLAKDLSNILAKHLDVTLKPEKQNNKISQKQEKKFWEMLDEETYK